MRKMFSSSLSRSQVWKRVNSIKLPRSIKTALAQKFFLWTDHSGEEWAVNRFKSIKTDFLQFKASGKKPGTPWIARTPAGNFKGIFGVLQRLMLTPQYLEVLRLMNIYTSLVSPIVTRTQSKKFISSMLSKGRTKEYSYYKDLILSVNQYPIPEVEVPIPLITTGSLRPQHEERLLNELVTRPYDLIDWMDHKDLLKILFRDLIPIDMLRYHLGNQVGDASMSAHWRPVVGRIHVTQEPGFKARFYADPFIWIQKMLDPLKSSLMHHLRFLPWDCTYDQRKADHKIVESLKSRKKVFCFDLSDATNLFPFDLQMSLLKSCYRGSTQVLDFFEDVCRSHWKCPDGVIRKFGRGQALGLGPSFPLFAWTHGMLLRSLLGRKWNQDFYIIGDDVVVFDPILATKYIKALEDLEVDWSPDKTLQSDVIAEFAGGLFTDKGLVWNPKWIPLRNSNILDVTSWWNLKFLENVCPKGIRNLVLRVLSLPSPWGAGWNPQGLSLSARLPDPLLNTLLEVKQDPEGVGYILDTYTRFKALMEKIPEKHWTRFTLLFEQLQVELSRSEQDRVGSTVFSGWKLPSRLFEMNAFLSDRSLPIPLGNISKRKDPLSIGSLSRWRRIFKESGLDPQLI